MTIRTYIIGFALSILLTLAAFWFVSQDVSHDVALLVLVGLAVAQLFVQLICFLHVGQGEKPRWNLITFIFTAFIVIVLVGGTIWVMHHLDRTHMNLSEIYEGDVISPQTQDD